MAQLVTDKGRTVHDAATTIRSGSAVRRAVLSAGHRRSNCAYEFSAEQQASRYTITVTANIQLRDVAKDTVLWSNPAISIREEYDATSSITNDPTGFVDPSSFFTQESNALERISNEFSRSVVSAILEAF